MHSPEKEQAIARKGRHVALVIAATMVIWLGVQVAAPKFGMPGRFALLFDFAALAAFVYAGVNIFQIWRARQDSQNNQG